MMFIRSLAICAALATFTLVARADTYEYSFQASYVSFSFDTSSLLTTDTTVSSGITGNYETTGTIDSLAFYPTSGSCIYGSGSCISIIYSAPGVSCFGPCFTNVFFGGPITEVGAYKYETDTLTISDLSTVASAPEPSSIALLGTGLLGIVGIARKRLT